ncbi:YncE family protein [Prevotella sp. PMUR]|uniref:YncE family protein n=2 Tax=Xylanibacter muris TaxID=2736290 RepID=A0ABX2AMA6_9BACT|nr:YncE family protein [Xylanibacter muris]
MVFVVFLLMASCRGDEYVMYSETEDSGMSVYSEGIKGMYVLNEGNMGSNKCTLDYLDLSGQETTGLYYRNIYAERNPGEVKELGDVGNDIGVYGSRLWMVINISNKVEVADAFSARKIGKTDIPNCRYLAFKDGYAYVSSYVGPVELGGKGRLGRVYKVDTLTLKKTDSVTVGFQPEEMAIVGNKMYVANSGGYNSRGYDRTVSVIDLETFREERKIDVAVNLHRCRSDRYGQVWVTSRGDYFDNPERLYVMEDAGGRGMVKADSLDVTVTDMCIVGDSLYYIGVSQMYNSDYGTFSSGIINVRTRQVVSESLSSSPEFMKMKKPYGIIVNPVSRDFYVMDAKDYVSSGSLLHFDSNGVFDISIRTGDIPGCAAFVTEKRKN